MIITVFFFILVGLFFDCHMAFRVATNVKGLWKLGNLKPICPNVRRYKLLMFNYLQMFGGFRPTEQKYKRITNVQSLPSAPNCHNTMLAVVFIFVVQVCPTKCPVLLQHLNTYGIEVLMCQHLHFVLPNPQNISLFLVCPCTC